MARRTARPPSTRTVRLAPVCRTCPVCGGTLWTAYQATRTVTTLEDVCQLILTVVRCHNIQCIRYHQSYRPEAEGAWAVPHGEFGLDVIACVGTLRYRDHRSVPEIHQALRVRQVAIAERTVSHLLARYEELVAVHLADHTRLRQRLAQQGRVILALDGLQPYQGQDVLWVIRDCLSGDVLLARSLDSTREADLADLLREVTDALPVPVHAVVSDGQQAIRLAVQRILPEVPHQLCHVHYLKEAARPIIAADHHAKTVCKKYVRGIRDIERFVARREDSEATIIRAYCLAVRSALTDEGKPPLHPPGLLLHDRLAAILASLERVQKKKGCPLRWASFTRWWDAVSSRPPTCGPHCARRTRGSSRRHRHWQTVRVRTRPQ